MWNSYRTDSNLGITAEITTFEGGSGDEIHAYVVKPSGEGPFPGVVVIHHMPGWDEFYQEFCERLGRHGYGVMAPDLYCRFGHGTPDDVAAKVRSQGGVPDDTVVADCAAANTWLRSQPWCSGRIGIIGSCSGGRHATLVASKVSGFDALVDLWGGGVVASADQATPARPVAPIDLTGQLTCPILGIFGNDDQSPTPEQVDIHEGELAKHGKEYEFHRYDGAGHGFFYYHAPMYRQEPAMDGWAKIFDFFGRKLRSQS